MRKNWWFGIALLAASLVLMGCPKSGTDKPANAKTDSASTDVKNPNEFGTTTAEVPKLDAMPANLKHQGFAYYGLGQTGAMTFEVISSMNPAPSTGEATSRLVSIEGGAAKFVTSRTGPLAQLGDEEIEVRPDGIYNTKLGGEPVEPAQLVIPAELPVGKSWTTKGSVKLADGKTLDQNIQFKVVGTEKVKTKAGEFDSLKVTATGQIKYDGTTSQSQVVAWYVKDLGIAKMTISTDKPKGTMSVELLKKPGAP